MAEYEIQFRSHAIQRMFERSISASDVRSVIDDGKVISEYPDDDPYPSQLLLGWSGDRPIHVVVAENSDDQVFVIVTVYEPDAELWGDNFERRIDS